MHVLDRLVALALPREKLFRDGWGDEDVLSSLTGDELRAAPDAIAVRWESARREGDVLVQDGAFESPERRLPPAARVARIRRLSPATGPARGMVLLLAASGDQGYAARTSLARPLVDAGITGLLLENAYYGGRRPPGQHGAHLRTVADLAVMAFATVKEAKALLALARVDVQRLCVAGYSMGGNLAAVVAATVPFPVAAVPMAPSASPAPVFTEGALRVLPALRALAAEGESLEDARARLRAFLARFDVTRLAPPIARRAAIVVGTRQDGFVPPSEMERLAAHWSCELRWLEAGHVLAHLIHGRAMRRAVLDALDRLEPDRR